MNRPLPLLLAALLAAGPLHAAKVYKWVDELGVTHFGDRPQSTLSEKLDVKPIPASGPAAPAPSAAPAPQPGAEPEASKDAPPEYQEYCRRAKDDLKRYQAADLLNRVNDKGETETLSDKEKAEVIERARKEVDRWCR